MKCLITGGCGFIGTNLIEFLFEKTDWEIVVLDNLTSGKVEDIESINGFSERGKFIKGDIRNKDDVLKAINECDYVVNLAAQVGVMPSIEDPLFDADINVNGLINVLQGCVDKKVKKVVHASSAAPLGDQDMPLDENKVPAPLSPYGASKLAGEGYCSAFAGSYGLNAVTLRFANVYGPKSYAKGSVVPLFIKQIMNGEQVTIYGDGEQTRDFIYVKDICNMIYLALTTTIDNNFELFQTATGQETSVNNLFKALKTVLESHEFKVEDPKYEPERPGEIARNYSDVSKAGKMLGYKPEVMLDDGLKKTVEWFLEQNKA